VTANIVRLNFQAVANIANDTTIISSAASQSPVFGVIVGFSHNMSSLALKLRP